jgi:hypothetical protein
MSRANPFGDLDDFAPQGAPKPKPVPAAAIEELAQASGFPSRKATRQAEPAPMDAPAPAPAPTAPPAPRTQRRRTTGRNRQINIKATEETIVELYRVADALDLPLGAVLERALAALAADPGHSG